MRFDFWNRETRSVGLTDALVEVLQSRADGEGSANALSLGALEICAGLWGRAFASAKVEPDNAATRSLTPDRLEMIGRELVRHGQVVFLIDVVGGEVELQPVSHWQVSGDADPRTWRYEVTREGPSRSITTRDVRVDRILHLKYAVDPARPWAGMSPLTHARETGKLAGNLEGRLSEEEMMAVGQIITTPDGKKKAGLQVDLRTLKGKLALVDSVSGGWGDGSQGAPRKDMAASRLGPMPPASQIDLRDSVSRTVLACCGVPLSTVEKVDGSASREGFRQFLHATILPVSLTVAGECADKLNTPELAFSFDRLKASDVVGRARAFQSMVGGGMEVEKAAALSGLLVEN